MVAGDIRTADQNHVETLLTQLQTEVFGSFRVGNVEEFLPGDVFLMETDPGQTAENGGKGEIQLIFRIVEHHRGTERRTFLDIDALARVPEDHSLLIQ
ncbi:hypothetical protein SDC9_173258 [bioreactor metagenome]|uniref:Uncharacterized protein n=1 Tax=bioreactor metagenome TaxID=1076179 RepID=A0A645GIN8_9ZZZZ